MLIQEIFTDIFEITFRKLRIPFMTSPCAAITYVRRLLVVLLYSNKFYFLTLLLCTPNHEIHSSFGKCVTLT